jgi:hypothetical protein
MFSMLFIRVLCCVITSGTVNLFWLFLKILDFLLFLNTKQLGNISDSHSNEYEDNGLLIIETD